jgi:hypothetical protein
LTLLDCVSRAAESARLGRRIDSKRSAMLLRSSMLALMRIARQRLRDKVGCPKTSIKKPQARSVNWRPLWLSPRAELNLDRIVVRSPVTLIQRVWRSGRIKWHPTHTVAKIERCITIRARTEPLEQEGGPATRYRRRIRYLAPSFRSPIGDQPR